MFEISSSKSHTLKIWFMDDVVCIKWYFLGREISYMTLTKDEWKEVAMFWKIIDEVNK